MRFGKRCVIGLCVVALLMGCYHPERNLSLDPANRSLIHVLSSKFDSQTGTVEIRWEYIGTKPVKAFRIDRRIESGFEELNRMEEPPKTTEYTTVVSFRDAQVLSGEKLQYRVIAEHEGSEIEQTETVEVSIPGFLFTGVQRDPVALSARLQWDGDRVGLSRLEVFRQIGALSEEKVYETTNMSETFYVDHGSSAQKLTYHIRSHFATGVVLNSRKWDVQFYRFGGSHAIENIRQGQESMRIDKGDGVVAGSMLALIARSQGLVLHELVYSFGVAFDGSPRILQTLLGTVFPVLSGIVPLSVDIVGPSFGEIGGLFPRVLIGGLTSTGQVDVVCFELPLLTQIWQGPSNWVVNPVGRVSLAKDAQKRIYIAAGNEVRVYTEQGVQVGGLPLNGEGPGDMAVFNTAIWVSWPQLDRIDRGELQFFGGTPIDINWQSIPLNAGAKPIALANNAHGQVFVLSAGAGEVFGYQIDGSPLISWKLPLANYTDGDITIDANASAGVHISNGRGDVLTYVP